MSLNQIAIPYDQLATLCQQWKINELSFFGSVLRQDFDAQKSDLDVMVDFKPESHCSLFGLSKMRDQLEILLGRKVDLITKKGLRNPIIRKNILESAYVVYSERAC